jgi:murein DD-endopeptidase MepM/ murein hydrolase activator NlpD
MKLHPPSTPPGLSQGFLILLILGAAVFTGAAACGFTPPAIPEADGAPETGSPPAVPGPAASGEHPREEMPANSEPAATPEIPAEEPAGLPDIEDPSPGSRVSTSPESGEDPPDPAAGICSPLAGVEVEQLPDLVSNPFSLPPPGSDEPHHGIDLADTGQNSVALPGRSVQAVLAGRTAAVIPDRFPYGNAILIETPLDEIPPAVRLPAIQPDLLTGQPLSLTCQEPFTAGQNLDDLSLYLLYAHLSQTPVFSPEDPIACGQELGAIGHSGNALNPHLHLEARIGPAGARFESLAHYHPSASLVEMQNYCLWRISGLFVPFNPLIIFSLWESP